MTKRNPRAANSGVKLTEHDAALIKGMALRGDRQADIAAYLGCNQGRVNEVITGSKVAFRHVEPATPSALPPPGPYVVVTRLEYEDAAVVKELTEELLRRFEEMVSEMRSKLVSLSEGKINAA